MKVCRPLFIIFDSRKKLTTTTTTTNKQTNKQTKKHPHPDRKVVYYFSTPKESLIRSSKMNPLMKTPYNNNSSR